MKYTWNTLAKENRTTKMKYIVLLLAFLAVANATQTRMGLRKDIKKLTGFSFLGVEAKVTASSEMQHKSAMAVANKASAGVGGMDNCQNCVYVLERIKQGYQYLLPSICVEIFSKEGESAGKDAYGVCHQVLASLSVWGNNVRHWLHYGCYKAESYGAMELIRPCPSHIICSQMADFAKKPFCSKVKQDELKAGR